MDRSLDSGGLSWSVRGRPGAPLCHACTPPPPWLRQLWAFRGEVLYANGRRPAFLGADGRYRDEDPRDWSACHALAYKQDQLVGCIRLVPIGGGTLTERILGAAGLRLALDEIGVASREAVEVGRWVVAEDQRGTALGMRLIAASWALCGRFGFKVALAAVGTRDRQDVLLARAGLRYVRAVGPIDSASYADRLAVMYGVVARPRPTFAAMVDALARLLPETVAEHDDVELLSRNSS